MHILVCYFYKFIENSKKIIKRKMRTFLNPHEVYFVVV
jgi:hypothetical protein